MARKDFHHPYQPYDIQQQFMEAMYGCIENGNVGIFESPTGTGKSLSLLCSSLTWLREHKRRKYDEAMTTVEYDDADPDWMIETARKARSREIRGMRADLESRLSAIRAREQKIKDHRSIEEPMRKRQKRDQEASDDLETDDAFLLDDYESDDDTTASTATQYSAKTTQLMEALGMLSKDAQDSREEVIEETKIFFCSRTHSQLSQFIGELKRVTLPPGMPPEDDKPTTHDSGEEVKHLTLGSRKNLCINKKVSSLKSQSAVNERCIELQGAKTAADKKCPYLPTKESKENVLTFRDHSLAKLRDIEDLAKLGSRLQICPYYASRSAIAPAEIVTLPYPLLLQKSARDALGISLKGHVVVIDEGHNLIDAVEGIYSAKVSDSQLQEAKDGIMLYLQKFRSRLKGKNRTYITQLVRVVDSLLSFANTARCGKSQGDSTSSTSLMSGKAVDQINLFKLSRYINESKLARKISGYSAHIADSKVQTVPHAQVAEDMQDKDVPTLTQVQTFLLTLMNPSREGRFMWCKRDGRVIIQYLLLDPSEHFRYVVEDARAVILAGGTMSPMEDYAQQLFPYLPAITKFSCGHLIPSSSLFVRSITRDDDGSLEFSFKARTRTNALRLGHALESVARTVNGGLVVFFPSYGYLESVVNTWQDDGIMASLQTSKPVFIDSRTTSAEDTFKAYSEAILESDKNGAIMLSVIGGKLSEGINFSDELGRCIIVVGLPYPNLETPEWKAKMTYLEEKAKMRGEAAGRASREHAENVCMRSVNQAIGRAIRHKNDWASILLFDARYTQTRIQAKLPGWIKTSHDATKSGHVKDVVGDLGAFFTRKMTGNA